MRGERSVRFGCGALAGVAVALSIAFGESTSTAGRTIMMGVGFAAVFGVAAALFGDQFWRWLWSIRWWLR